MKVVNKEKVKNYLLRLIQNKRKDYITKTVEAFEISKSSVYNYIKQMEEEGLIEKKEKEYVLKTRTAYFNFQNDGTLSEDKVYNDYISEKIRFTKNVNSIWYYAFTEMMNNAIEHSKANNIGVNILQTSIDTKVLIMDDGIGIFKNIQNYMKESQNESLSLNDCVSLLFAGKFTTAKDFHTGEGIFFTSHIMDEFIVYSDDNFFTRNNFKSLQIQDDNFHSYMQMKQGTIVRMSLNNNSRKTLSKVFEIFSPNDEGFVKTKIPVAHMFSNGNPISRSEARRLLNSISSFNDVILDFAGVEEIGQGFAHELFILGEQRFPNIKLKPVNTGKLVDAMIKRVVNTSKL